LKRQQANIGRVRCAASLDFSLTDGLVKKLRHRRFPTQNNTTTAIMPAVQMPSGKNVVLLGKHPPARPKPTFASVSLYSIRIKNAPLETEVQIFNHCHTH